MSAKHLTLILESSDLPLRPSLVFLYMPIPFFSRRQIFLYTPQRIACCQRIAVQINTSHHHLSSFTAVKIHPFSCVYSQIGEFKIDTKHIFALKSVRMSSDDAYASFLDQANQDTGASKASTQSQPQKASINAVDTEVPPALQSIEQYYVSEADEPFEPVSLKWGGSNMPSESELCHQIKP